MRSTLPKLLYFWVIIILVVSACSSGKSSLEHGNYYEAVITAINRLRRNTDNKKSSETLRAAYPLAVKYYEDRATTAIAGNSPGKWKEVVQHYSTLQGLYDEIQRSPGALQVIPKPFNYQAKIAEASNKAAEESYQAGILALTVGDRASAKRAYFLFLDCNNFVNGYRDVNDYLKKSLEVATVKVAVEPIPVMARNYSINAQYFDNKMNEFLQANNGNQFVKFYRAADAIQQRIMPDHIIQLAFDEFTIGQVYMNEKESQVEKDSVVLAYTYTDTKGALLRKDIEPAKIAPPIVKSADTKVVDKTVDTKPVVVTPTEEKKPEEKPADTVKPAEEKKPEEKPADVVKPAEEKKPEEKPADVVKPAEENKPAEEKKPEEKKDESNKDENKNEEKKPDEKKDDGNTGGTKETMVTLCHQPPGKPAERKTLTVPQSAVKAHLAHGDYVGECKAAEKTDDKNKGKDKGNGNGNDGGMAYLNDSQAQQVLIASASSNWLSYFSMPEATVDTTKIYGKVKATVRHFRKTVTSRGVLNFRIVDAKTRAVISEERMPSEFVWASEWLTYNGDSRALTPQQLNLAKQRELPQPSNQDLFTEFTKPLFTQISAKITEYYRNY